MSRLSWWLVDVVSRMLDSRDRDAVRGDLAEAEVSGARALFDVLGLVIRRQAGLWRGWRPWLALVGIDLCVYLSLSEFWEYLINTLVVRLAVYNEGSLYESALPASQDHFVLFCQCFALITWLWTSGFVMGFLSRRTTWITAPLFYALWWLPGVHFLHPFLVLNTIVLIPSIMGLGQGLFVRRLARRAAAAMAVWTLTISVLALWTRGWWDEAMAQWSHGAIQYHSVTWHTWLLAAICCWPAAFLAAAARPVKTRFSGR